jgi:membrane fusion protein (multidrug efflux system)
VAIAVVLGLLGGALVFFLAGNAHHATASTGDEGSEQVEELPISVKIVRPRYDKEFTMTEKRPADVLPYFESPLETRVPGIVSAIRADVGTIVKKGDALVDVSVPDLEARVSQRQADVKLAEAQIDQKKAAKVTSEAQVEAAKARANAARARERSDIKYREFRQKQRDRYAALLRDRAIDAQLVDEQEDRLYAAIEAVNASHEAVAYAVSEVKASEARIKQAEADLEEAQKNVDAKKAELGYAKAMYDYATIRAPFDGQIVRRNVDPGFFVQVSGSGHATPLLVIQRNDIVTVIMRLPDKFAPYITPQTEAILETPLMPGLKIHGKVTRYPDSLLNPEKDRTMLVEVDLWNRSAEDFAVKMKEQTFLDNLKPGLPNDPNRGRPVVPQIKGKLAGGLQKRLLPGTYCDMTLVLRKFENIYMLPSSSIVTIGGVQYIYVVKDGKAHLQRVKDQVNDGKLVKVELLDDNGEVVGDLTGSEEVIVSNQGELSEGQPVKPVLVENWKTLAPGGDANAKR